MADTNLKVFCGLTLLLTVLSYCSGQVSQGTILDVLRNTNGLKTFASWCQETFPGLYSGSGVLTVFAFNDTAYTYTMPSAERSRLTSLSLEEKREYVTTYTLESRISVDQMRDATVQVSINGKRLFINRRDRVYWNPGSTTGTTAVYVNGAMIIREQIQASNGIIHVLDRPLSLVSDQNVYQFLNNPEDPTIQTTTIMMLAERIYGEFFTSVISPISNTDRVTFFLPSENALRQIPNSKLMSLNGIELANYFKMHYVLNRVVYTSYVEPQENYETAHTGIRVKFSRQDGKVYVKSGGVTAMIERGNITVRNGVIHIIDRMFGYVYNSAREQIALDAPTFNRLIDRVSPDLQAKITQPSGVHMFVPMEDAFTYIQNLRGVNLETNTSLINYLVRLCVIKDGSIDISQLNGNYDVRQRRYSEYGNWKMVIYLDRNETWVNAGNVRARIVRPDVKVTTGVLQYIDQVLGVPSYDIPTLIYYDDYLIYTYNDLRSVGLVDYLKDQSYDSSYLPPRSFNQYGNGVNNFGQPNNYDLLYTTQTPNQYPTEYPGQITNRPNNIPEQEFYRRQQLQQQSGQNGNNPYGNTQSPYGQNQYGNQNNQYGNQNNQYGNQNNQYGNQNNQYGNQNNYGNNQYGNNQYGNNQYGNNQYGNNQYGSSSYYGTCGSAISVCQFTVFVPNGTAVYNYYMTSLGNQITRDLPRYRWVLRRLIIPNQLVFIEQLPVSSQSYRYTAHNGDQLILRKESENTVRLSWSGMSARVIMSDLGATNGVVHIIDTVLSQLSDQTVDISASTALSGNFCVFGLIAFTLCLLHKLWR